MRLFQKIWNRGTKTLVKKPEKETPEGFPFTRFVTFGAHQYRRTGERCDVSFINLQTGKSRRIVDNFGNICNSPGIIKEDCWIKELISENYMKPVVRFRTSFEKWDEERYIMLWQIQPDGQYWAEDGRFGMEDDLEITLYSFINHNGEFMGPFRVYCVGDKKYLTRKSL